MGLEYTASPACLVDPSVYLQLWKIFSASLRVVLIDSCSVVTTVNRCNFGVPGEEGNSGSSYSAFRPHSMIIHLITKRHSKNKLSFI